MTRIKYGYLHWTDTDIFIQKIENISQAVSQENVNDFSINANLSATFYIQQ